MEEDSREGLLGVVTWRSLAEQLPYWR